MTEDSLQHLLDRLADVCERSKVYHSLFLSVVMLFDDRHQHSVLSQKQLLCGRVVSLSFFRPLSNGMTEREEERRKEKRP